MKTKRSVLLQISLLVASVGIVFSLSTIAQANPIEAERNRKLEFVGTEISFLKKFCFQILRQNTPASDGALVAELNARGYDTGQGVVSSIYEDIGLKMEDFFFEQDQWMIILAVK